MPSLSLKSFYLTKYFIHSHIILLLSIFSTSHSSLSTSTSFGFSIFYLFTSFLYLTTLLIFTIEWSLINTSSLSLTTLTDTISSIVHSLMYCSVNFLAYLSLNTKSLVFSIALLVFSHFSASFCSLYPCLFISFCVFLNTTLTFFYIFLILFTNSVTFSTFPFCLISTSICSSLLQFSMNDETLVTT